LKEKIMIMGQVLFKNNIGPISAKKKLYKDEN